MLNSKELFAKYEKLRENRGLKDVDVARLSGVDQSTISCWRNGKYMPKPDKLEKIAKVLGESYTSFISEVSV